MPRPRFLNLPDNKREQILSAARKEFAIHGYDGASLNRIIGAAGISKGALYYYFDGKVDLFVTVIRQLDEELFAGMKFRIADLETDDYWAKLGALTRAGLDVVHRNPDAIGLVRAFYRLPPKTRSEGEIGIYLQERGRWLAQLIERGQALGLIRADLPNELILQLWIALDEVIDCWALANWERPTREEHERLYRLSLNLMRRVAEPLEGTMSMSPRKTLVAALATALIAMANGAAPAAAEPPLPDPKAVIAHLNDLYSHGSSHATITMETSTDHYQHNFTLEWWSTGKDLALTIVREPKRHAGMAMLRTDKGLWAYTPRSDRLLPIPVALLGDSWLGSHFTNDDLMRKFSWNDDYDVALTWITDGGTRYLEVMSTSKPSSRVVYTKVVQRLTADSWLPVSADYYQDDAVVRHMRFSELKDFGGRKIPTVLKVIPTDKHNETTRVVFTEIELDVRIDPKLFTPVGLRRAAQGR